MRIKSQRDFCSGVLFSAFGVAFAWGATTYNVGSGALMGVLITLKALSVETEDGEPIGSIAWKPLVFIIGANLIFGVLLGGLPSIGLPSMGLIVAIYALTFIASLAGDNFGWKGVTVLASILALGSYLAFVVALKLQFQVWPTFISG